MSEELQAVVLEAGKKAVLLAYNRRESRAAEAANIAMAEENGVTVIPFTREMKMEFANRVRPAAVEWLKENVNTPELVDEVIAEVDRLAN